MVGHASLVCSFGVHIYFLGVFLMTMTANFRQNLPAGKFELQMSTV